MSSADIPFAIIGGGVIGRAIALVLRRRGEEVVVVESGHRNRIENQSTRNSGVIHAGIYYDKHDKPNKALLCVEGNRLIYEFCQEFEVPYARTGKLIVAIRAQEEAYLDALLQTARDNQIPGVVRIDGKELSRLEPNISAISALHIPSSGIVDAASYLKVLQRLGQSHNLFSTQVVEVKKISSGFEIRTRSMGKIRTFVAQTVFNAAGLYSDSVAKMINRESPYEIMPVRGESAKFYSNRRPKLAMRGMNVYPVPCGFYRSNSPNAGKRAEVSYSEFRRLLSRGEITETTGIHLTPTLDGSGKLSNTVTIGPAITVGLGKDDVQTQLRTPEFYWQRVNDFFPNLRLEDIELHQCGVQARLADYPDWILQPDPTEPRFINLIGIDSPGLTASLALAREVVEYI